MSNYSIKHLLQSSVFMQLVRVMEVLQYHVNLFTTGLHYIAVDNFMD